MKQSMYTVLDEKAGKIGPVFLCNSDDEAERMVSIALEKDSLVTRYPADFALLRLGDIALSTGIIEPHAVPVLVKKLDEIFIEVVTGPEK